MSSNKSLKRRIKNLDFFGHQVQLNFDKKGSTHQSLLGGIMSCLYFCFIVAFIVFSSIKINLGESDVITSSVIRNQAENFTDFAQVNAEYIFQV